MAHPMNDQRGGFPVTGAVARHSLRPQDARRHHRALVLSLLQRSPGSSRAQLARSTGLSQVAISGVVAELIAEGIVAEQGIRPSTRPGAPARALHLISAARTVAAVAISSADEIEGTLFDLTGTQLFHTTVSRAGAVGPDALALLEGVIETVLQQAEAPVLGIGVSATGIIDADGVVRSSSHLAWSDLPLREHLEQRMRLPVAVVGGVTAIGIAEVTEGDTSHDLLMVRIGNGVGAATIVNGSVVHGLHGAAGEFGHVVVDPASDRLCQCGRRGCLEATLATPQLRDRLARASASEHDTVLAEAGRMLGIALAPAVAVLGLTDIAVTGPRDLIEGPLLAACRDQLAESLLDVVAARLHVRIAEGDESARLRGVFAIVLSNELGIA